MTPRRRLPFLTVTKIDSVLLFMFRRANSYRRRAKNTHTHTHKKFRYRKSIITFYGNNNVFERVRREIFKNKKK